MSRYIDADFLIPETVTVLEYGGDDGRRLYGSKIQVYSKKQIDEAPTADVLENVHGEWRYGENNIGLDGYWCTACGEFVLWDYKETIDFIHRYNFCPNCGARMKPRKENDEREML